MTDSSWSHDGFYGRPTGLIFRNSKQTKRRKKKLNTYDKKNNNTWNCVSKLYAREKFYPLNPFKCLCTKSYFTLCDNNLFQPPKWQVIHEWTNNYRRVFCVDHSNQPTNATNSTTNTSQWISNNLKIIYKIVQSHESPVLASGRKSPLQNISLNKELYCHSFHCTALSYVPRGRVCVSGCWRWWQVTSDIWYIINIMF